MVYDSAGWSVKVAEGWSCRPDAASAEFSHASGSAVLRIHSTTQETEVDDETLVLLASEDNAPSLAATTFSRLSGFCDHRADSGSCNIQWWLKSGRQIIHIEYSSSPELHSEIAGEVSAMIATIVPKPISAASKGELA